MRLIIIVCIVSAVFALAWHVLKPAEATPRYQIHMGKPVPAQARDHSNNN